MIKKNPVFFVGGLHDRGFSSTSNMNVQRFCLKTCYPVTSSYLFGKQSSFYPKCGVTFCVMKVGK